MSAPRMAAPPAGPGAFTANLGETIHFLHRLGRNNTKAWFDAHRAEYERHYLAPARELVNALGPGLRAIMPQVRFADRVNGSIFRIHRDIRFSRDKTPYKDHLDLWFWLGEKQGWNTPSFFFRLTAEQLVLGAGLHRMDKPTLGRYREAVLHRSAGAELEALLAGLTDGGPYTLGEPTRKTVPRGLDAGHPRARLLLHEGLSAALEGPIPDVAFSPGFIGYCLGHYRALAPLNRWLMVHLG